MTIAADSIAPRRAILRQPSHAPLSLPWRFAICLIVVFLIIPVGLVALGSGLGLIALPYEMFLLAERIPSVFRLHMVTGALVLLLAPAVVAVRNNRGVHRMLGRVLGGFVIVSGLTALHVAIMSASSIARGNSNGKKRAAK